MRHLNLIILSFLIFFLSSCIKDPEMNTNVRNAKVPTVNTLFDEQQHPIKKTSTTITFDAVVTSGNGLPVDAYGVCWDTKPDPTIENSDTVVCGKGVMSFKGTASKLLPETQYYVRPFATNAKGTSYGEAFTATTNKWSGIVNTLLLKDSLKAESAYCGGKIIMSGEGVIKERGIYLTTPTTKDSVIPIPISADSFVYKIANLQPVSLYSFRAYVTNEYGTYFGTQVEFSTTNGCALVNSLKKISEGFIDSGFEATVQTEGDKHVTARGFCWGITSGAVIESGDTTVNGAGKGTFNGLVTNLKPASQYYIRAYATNGYGTSYSEEVSFWTKSATPRLSAVTIKSTNVGGTLSVAAEVLDEGESEVTESGISYSLVPDDKTGNTKLALSSGIGIYYGELTSLKGGSTYYIRAYAINKKGVIAYGEESSYKTPDIFIARTVFKGSNLFGNAVAVASLGSSGFILGGDAGRDKTNEFYAYRADRDEWLEFNPFPEKRKWQTAVGTNLAIVAFGGDNSISERKNDLYVYSSLSNSWTEIKYNATAEHPSPLAQATGFEYNGNIYILGGLNNNNIATSEIWSIKPQDGQSWTKVATTFPVAQCRGIVVTINDKVYAGLGTDASNICNKKLWTSSADLTQWSELSPITSNVRCGVAFKGNIYVVDESGYIWKYDVATNSWMKKSQMPSGYREIYCMYSLGGLIYLTQGTSNSPIISYDPSWDN